MPSMNHISTLSITLTKKNIPPLHPNRRFNIIKIKNSASPIDINSSQLMPNKLSSTEKTRVNEDLYNQHCSASRSGIKCSQENTIPEIQTSTSSPVHTPILDFITTASTFVQIQTQPESTESKLSPVSSIPVQATSDLTFPKQPTVNTLNQEEFDPLARELEISYSLPRGSLQPKDFKTSSEMLETARAISIAMHDEDNSDLQREIQQAEITQITTSGSINTRVLTRIIETLNGTSINVKELITVIHNIKRLLRIDSVLQTPQVSIISFGMQISTAWDPDNSSYSLETITQLRFYLREIFILYDNLTNELGTQWDQITTTNTKSNTSSNELSHLKAIKKAQLDNAPALLESASCSQSFSQLDSQHPFPLVSKRKNSHISQKVRFNISEPSQAQILSPVIYGSPNVDNPIYSTSQTELKEFAQALEISLNLPLGTIPINSYSTELTLQDAALLFYKAQEE